MGTNTNNWFRNIFTYCMYLCIQNNQLIWKDWVVIRLKLIKWEPTLIVFFWGEMTACCTFYSVKRWNIPLFLTGYWIFYNIKSTLQGFPSKTLKNCQLLSSYFKNMKNLSIGNLNLFIKFWSEIQVVPIQVLCTGYLR